MNNIKIVDTRGLSCPEPVMLTHQALQKLEKGTIEVLVDTGTARENVFRLAKNSGWEVNLEEQPDGSYRILLTK
jgi:tRNA 2-thiouridine synthesizing protein A